MTDSLHDAGMTVRREVLGDVAQALEREQEATRGRARQPRRAGDVAERLRLGAAEGADHRQAALQRLDELPVARRRFAHPSPASAAPASRSTAWARANAAFDRGTPA